MKQKIMEKVKSSVGNSRGITLIALVITIVIMLILAGVTINLTLGQNGIFTTAQKAAQNYTQAQNQEMAGIDSFTSTIDKVVESVQNNYEIAGTVLKTENNINYTADGAGNTIPVPAGFSPITTPDQGTKDTGFVIKNDNDNNEFVWIPVETYERIAWQRADWKYTQDVLEGIDEDTESIRITRDDQGDTYFFTEKMPEEEKTSVAIYRGFYIGRYEAGIINGKLSYTSNSDVSDPELKQNWTGWTGDNIKLVIQSNQQPWNYITRDKAKRVSEDLYSKNIHNVVSKLCSSYAWDSALKFIEKRNNIYPTDSTGDNYSVATGGTEKQQRTGYYAKNNIYDVAGNQAEWTTEKTNSPYNPWVVRGGFYGDSALLQPAAHRNGGHITGVHEGISFRVTLFL